MTGFNPDEYVDVAERITQFYDRYPDGRLTTVDFYPQQIGDRNFVVCHAKAYRTQDDPLPGDGVAWEPVPGPSPFTKDSELMNAQTAAVGRAIAMVGFATKKIASKQEVQARQNGDPHGLQQSRADTVPADQIVFTFGKHKGKRINEVPTNYLEWWLTSDSAKADSNQELRAAVELRLGLTSVIAAGAPSGSDGLDDIPFAPSEF